MPAAHASASITMQGSWPRSGRAGGRCGSPGMPRPAEGGMASSCACLCRAARIEAPGFRPCAGEPAIPGRASSEDRAPRRLRGPAACASPPCRGGVHYCPPGDLAGESPGSRRDPAKVQFKRRLARLDICVRAAGGRRRVVAADRASRTRSPLRGAIASTSGTWPLRTEGPQLVDHNALPTRHSTQHGYRNPGCRLSTFSTITSCSQPSPKS
jgi:hypothetical protein